MNPFNAIEHLSQTREEYGTCSLLEENIHPDPIEQFKIWFQQYANIQPTTHNAMVLSTVDQYNHPDSRIVLLKELDKDQFIFYTEYSGVKGLQMEINPFVALNFYWPEQARQIRIRGSVHRVSAAQSDKYFYSRPRESQLACMASPQSMKILGRQALETAYLKVFEKYADKATVRPETWGGYAVVPNQIEFWQGRDNRLHDRIQYTRHQEQWCIERLTP
ncbi:MAG TPA: pyridoxamine 5'-phosphate oxidase [Legionellaceae bacterium]|nr:pyridoxamine 5'-phosphate oxidase [Legionellaceae bacterium]